MNPMSGQKNGSWLGVIMISVVLLSVFPIGGWISMQFNPSLKTVACKNLGVACEPEVKPAAKVEAKAKLTPADIAFWNIQYNKTEPSILLDEMEYILDPAKYVPVCSTGKTLHLPNIYLQKVDDMVNTGKDGSFDWHVCKSGKTTFNASKKSDSSQFAMTADTDDLVSQGQRIQTFVNDKLTN